MNISIYYEAGGEAGQGHKQRMTYLAEALILRGHKIWMIDKPINDQLLPATPLAIIDVPVNDDQFLCKLKRMGEDTKLVVFVGVGKSITLRTAWIADLIVYQAVHDRAPNLPHGLFDWKIVGGPSYVMASPDIDRNQEKTIPVVLYFGAGHSHEYARSIADAMPIDSILAPDELGEIRWPNAISRAREYVGSMGMSANDAAAAGAKVTVVCSTDEHLADAKAAGFSIAGLGEPSLAQINDARSRAVTIDTIDTLGVYRVAHDILGLVDD